MENAPSHPNRGINFLLVFLLAAALAGIPVLSPADYQHYDGDGLADALAIDNGDWYAWPSTADYQLSTNMPGPAWTGGTYAMADFDGDRLVDCAMTVQSQWYFWFSIYKPGTVRAWSFRRPTAGRRY